MAPVPVPVPETPSSPGEVLVPAVVDCSAWTAENFDWSQLYLTEEEDMGQSGEQGAIIEVFLSSLKVLAEERGWSAVQVAADNFFAWNPAEHYLQVSPDVYLLDDPPPGPRPARYETWKHSPPRFALEVVSTDWKKDYRRNPQRYALLGTSELILADADAFAQKTRVKGRRGFVKYRLSGAGRMVRTYWGKGPVYSEELDAWLRFTCEEGEGPRVRLFRDKAGRDRVPTADERARAAEQDKLAADERARAAEQDKLAADERARAAERDKLAADERARAAEQDKLAEAERADAAEQARLAEAERADAADQRAKAAEATSARLLAELAALRQKLGTTD